MPGNFIPELSVCFTILPDNSHACDLRKGIKLPGWFKHSFIYALANLSINHNSAVHHLIQ